MLDQVNKPSSSDKDTTWKNRDLSEIRFLCGSGGLGSGKVLQSAVDEAMTFDPHFIAADAGTSDSGPYALGSGKPDYPRETIKHDMTILLVAARRAGIPLIIGSSGTAGLDSQVDLFVEIANEVAIENGFKVRTAAIYSEQSKEYLLGLMKEGRIRALDPAPHLDEDVIRSSAHVVGMMGVEPLQRAISEGAELVIGGRCSDSALFAAIPIMEGFPEGLAWHAGKVMECGTQVCVKVGRGTVAAAMSKDSFTMRVYGKGLAITPQSVAAHSFYENGDPYIHYEASGAMDLSECRYEAAENGRVKVSGSAFRHGDDYTIKLEGAVKVGYQAVVIGGMRDPYFIRNLDTWLPTVEGVIENAVRDILGLERDKDYRLVFHQYGRNAVMGALEPETDFPREVCLILEVTAGSQQIATKIAELSRQPLLHQPIPEWNGSITSIAYLHNPVPLERGAVYRFAYNHVALPRDKEEMFRMKIVEIG
ncbi:acyclic terpene utilization AtuA family protein [Pseudochelatococcus sp. B33]